MRRLRWFSFVLQRRMGRSRGCGCYENDVFTGLVETTGKLARREEHGPGFRLDVSCSLEELELGESISVNGACLTVTRFDENGFSADVSVETAEKTTLGRLEVGGDVNLERSLALGDRLGGHLVSGHVDGVGEITRMERQGDAIRVDCRAPAELMKYVAPKGSITLDGVSLTVNGVSDGGFHVMLIPHTVEVTTFRNAKPSSAVNLEVDLLARYVVRYLEARGDDADDVVEALERAGRL